MSLTGRLIILFFFSVILDIDVTIFLLQKQLKGFLVCPVPVPYLHEVQWQWRSWHFIAEGHPGAQGLLHHQGREADQRDSPARRHQETLLQPWCRSDQPRAPHSILPAPASPNVSPPHPGGRSGDDWRPLNGLVRAWIWRPISGLGPLNVATSAQKKQFTPICCQGNIKSVHFDSGQVLGLPLVLTLTWLLKRDF